VSLVYHAVETLKGQSRQTLSLAAAPICCLALLGGCGGSSHPKKRVGANTTLGVGPSISLDNCTDWQRGTIAQRRDTVVELRQFAGGPVGSSAGIQRGPVLSDARAYKLFQSYCASYFARGFSLYRLYTRAAGFAGH
jgi:hypothetical protein